MPGMDELWVIGCILLMEKCQGLICGPGLMRMARFRPILTEMLFIEM
jgi:hypothetical protein